MFQMQTNQIKVQSSLILNTRFIASIYEDITPSDKVLNEKFKFLSEILIILVSKWV